MVLSAKVRHFRREKLIGWEINAAKQLTGVIRCSHTFLIRDTEIISGYQHLDIALDLYNGKDTNGSINHFTGIFGAEVSSVLFADAFRDTAAALAGRRRITQAGRKADGTGYLYAGFRQNLPAGGILFCWRIIRVEHFYISFASIKDYLFIEDGNAAYDYAARVGRAEYV